MRRCCAEVPGADSVALMRLSRAISERQGVSGSTPPDPASLRTDDREEPRLDAPGVYEIVQLAGTGETSGDKARTAVLRAMRKAAEKRVAGVIENKRRRHYDHAAKLVATCDALDSSPETVSWVAGVRDEYRRYPAFQRELASHLRH